MNEAKRKFNTQISRDELLANGGSPSLNPSQYKGLSSSEKMKYNSQNSAALARITSKRRSISPTHG